MAVRVLYGNRFAFCTETKNFPKPLYLQMFPTILTPKFNVYLVRVLYGNEKTTGTPLFTGVPDDFNP